MKEYTVSDQMYSFVGVSGLSTYLFSNFFNRLVLFLGMNYIDVIYLSCLSESRGLEFRKGQTFPR